MLLNINKLSPGFKNRIATFLEKYGLTVSGYGHANNLRHIFEKNNVGVVIDVGANTGQYAKWLRNIVRYNKKIISIEPSMEAHQRLQQNAGADANWTAVPRCALGPVTGEALLHVSADSVCSSILPTTKNFENIVERARTVSEEIVPIRTLREIYDEYVVAGDQVFLKVDTQGFERQVMAGLGDDLSLWPVIQLELSLTPLYEGEASLSAMIIYLESLGYSLYAIFPTFWSRPSYQLRQADCIFTRNI
jgi:FkbM family methyltransferase